MVKGWQEIRKLITTEKLLNMIVQNDEILNYFQLITAFGFKRKSVNETSCLIRQQSFLDQDVYLFPPKINELSMMLNFFYDNNFKKI